MKFLLPRFKTKELSIVRVYSELLAIFLNFVTTKKEL